MNLIVPLIEGRHFRASTAHFSCGGEFEARDINPLFHFHLRRWCMSR